MKKAILLKYQRWMRDVLIKKHLRNTLKLKNIGEFNINPFTHLYLSYFFGGEASYETMAKTLIYPRVLGTSIATSFGSNMQNFIATVLGDYGSTTKVMDIEFIDKLDGRKKYAQLKSGPNSINKGMTRLCTNHWRLC